MELSDYLNVLKKIMPIFIIKIKYFMITLEYEALEKGLQILQEKVSEIEQKVKNFNSSCVP